jgi:signal transduction histidine kinase
LGDIDPGIRELINGSTTRIEKIAEDLLSNSRSKGQIKKEGLVDRAHVEKMDCALAVRQIVEEKRMEYLSRKGIVFEVSIPARSDTTLNFDSHVFSRILSNLLNNAVEATVGDGIIRISIRSSEKEVQLIIQDQGKGISHENLSRIGEKGFTLGQGNGLGVSHAKDEVEKINGKLEIHSQLGQGTMLILHFPRVP